MSLLSVILKKTWRLWRFKTALKTFAVLAMAAPNISAAQEAPQPLSSNPDSGLQSAAPVSPDLAKEPDAPPTLDAVFAEICAAGILYPEIVMSQVQLETGKLTNKMLLSRNNLFGFRLKSYLSFSRWQDSVAYYKRWQDRKYLNKNEDYFKFLDRVRFASGNYKHHVLRFKWNKSCSQIG